MVAQALVGSAAATLLYVGAVATASPAYLDCSRDLLELGRSRCLDDPPAEYNVFHLAIPFLVPAAITVVGELQGRRGSFWASLAGSLLGAAPGVLALGSSSSASGNHDELGLLVPLGAVAGSLIGYALSEPAPLPAPRRASLTPTLAVDPRGSASVGVSGAF